VMERWRSPEARPPVTVRLTRRVAIIICLLHPQEGWRRTYWSPAFKQDGGEHGCEWMTLSSGLIVKPILRWDAWYNWHSLLACCLAPQTCQDTLSGSHSLWVLTMP
jgi:hypothetical protein